MGKTGAKILGFAGAILALWNPPLFFSWASWLGGGYIGSLGGAYIGLAMMAAGGLWAGYEQRKALQRALEEASRAASAIKSNTRTSQRPIPIVYGKCRVGGNIIYQLTGHHQGVDGVHNQALHTIYGICEGPIENFTGMWCDDTFVWASNSDDPYNVSSGFVDGTGNWKHWFTTAHPDGKNYYDLEFRLGCNSQDYIRQINSIGIGGGWDMSGKWGRSHDLDFADRYPMTALAYVSLYFHTRDDWNPFQGVPTISWEIQGKRVRDINNINSLHWTENPAHHVFDLMTNKQYGWSIPSSKIDLPSFQAVGSFCHTVETWTETEEITVLEPTPYKHYAEATNYYKWTFFDVEDPQPMTNEWNPNGDSYPSRARGGWNPKAVTLYDPKSYSKVPMVAGSFRITVTQTLRAQGDFMSIVWGIYGDASSNLRFSGYKELGRDGKNFLIAREFTGGAQEYMAYQLGYAGGDISSGTIIGAIDYSVGTASWEVTSISGYFSGQEYDENEYYQFDSGFQKLEAEWFYGYGGSAIVGRDYLDPGNITITADTTEGTEIITPVSSGSWDGWLAGNLTYLGKWAQGGHVDFTSGNLVYYFKGNPIGGASAVSIQTQYRDYTGYSYNGIIADSKPAVDQVRDLLQHFRGYLVYNQGVYQLKVDKAETPVFAFDEDNIKAGSFVITQTPISERPNRIRVKYTDRAKGYSQAEVIYEPENAILPVEDVVIEHILALPGCVYKEQAIKMAQTLGKQAQLGNTCQFITGQDGASVDVGNVITITWPPASWVDKGFRIIEIEEKPEEEWAISCIEYDASVYADE